MEKRRSRQPPGPTKRLRPATTTPHRPPPNPATVIAVTLAALISASFSSSSTLKPSLTNLLRLLSSSSTSPPPSPDLLNLTLSFLPSLLSPSQPCEILLIVLRIVGAVSLLSFEANERVAKEKGIVKAVTAKVVNCERKVAVAACDAVLDLGTTELGRRRLIEASALDFLMIGFIQVYQASKPPISISFVDKGDVVHLGVENSEDELLMLLISATVTLINSCNTEHLEELPKKLVETVVVHFRQIWANGRKQISAWKVENICKRKHTCHRNLTASNFVESLFRLSMNASPSTCAMPSEVIMRQIFGSWTSCFTDFLSKHWESSTFLLRKPMRSLDGEGDIFRPFLQLLNSSRKFPFPLSSILQGMVSCVPIASDETSVINFLEEKGNILGCPLIYEQDIRVLRTDSISKTEKHYFEGSMSNDSTSSHSFIYMDDLIKFEDAYKLGYTIALRGMEFRCPVIAAIADEIAAFFGQPSTGANLYLTPRNSQGLACHYDDHCVFVCQLLGSKRWAISSDPVVQLPRLYQHLQHLPASTAQWRHAILREGDILYIPRGIPHEASTSMGGDGLDVAADFSLHLTLSVEIEPPFEWEGFSHVALHRWSHNNLYTSQKLATGLHSTMDVISTGFLHVAIELLGNSDLVFRKACLVAADCSNLDAKNWLDQNQRAIFNQLISKINKMSNFTEVLESVRMTIQRSEDPFHRIRWLSLLTRKEMNEQFWDSPFEGIDKLLPLIYQHKDEVEAAFMTIKSKFCREIIFEDVERSFKIIHAMYKKTRKQYQNGMLGLHF